MRDLEEAPLLRLDALGAAADDDGWALTARCRGEDPTLFFGPNRFEPKRERLTREAAAKAVCAGCPALAECREHALTEGELYGVWGGLGESDRRSILAARGGAMPRSA
ncbi:WhiB family transcriptional regulator [Nitriliruptor alkaliphilus]|uniref:WhiB family transcriptional regulator n=1 Tax=Nitriliruptor alkaliphilus TaxID=427918 RepID=UPI0009FAF9B9|nr:WhiB family transcriptional regulator [Nitriliruptor alkaliphilus]